MRRHDESAFSCMAENEGGQAESHFSVQVLVPPQIEGSTFENVILVEGGGMELQCATHGVPLPEILWTKDNEKIIGDIANVFQIVFKMYFYCIFSCTTTTNFSILQK